MLTRSLRQFVQRSSFLRKLLRLVRTRQVVLLEYPVDSRPRYGHGRPAHPELYDLLNAGRRDYAALLTRFRDYREHFARIELHARRDCPDPGWINGYLPALDAIALYGMLATSNPARYFEIGSGHSTRFARRAVRDHGLRTTITSVDPAPRASVDAIADRVIRRPLEALDLSLLSELSPGDVLFYDGSHRCFMNSDVTVFFLEVLPRLPAGVLVHVHDVTLPYDYPPDYAERYYSEQYLLACWLLASAPRTDGAAMPAARLRVVLPNAFVTHDAELHAMLDPVWNEPALAGVGRYGGSFWMEVR